MKVFVVSLILAGISAGLWAAPPTYGSLKIDRSSATIYEGASAHSKVAGHASEGEIFDLRGDKLYNGFYKIEYKGHICFVMATQVALQGAEENEADDSDNGPAPTATAVVKIFPTTVPTVAQDDDSEEMATPIPTRQATKVPTLAPTEEPEAEPTVMPMRVATRVPSLAPTAEPKEEETVAPTAIPTRAYAASTVVPTVRPTTRPTATWVPQPTPVQGPTRAKGRTIQRNVVQPQRSSGSIVGSRLRTSSSASSGTTINLPPRDPNKLSSLVLTLPIGLGKPYEVKPAFKALPGDLDSRNIDASGFVGLGLEARVFPFLRIFGDWTAYSHWTRAADAGAVAPAVNVPGVTSLLSDTDIRYAMDTHGFRVGAKLGLPLGARFEPWIGGGAGLYAWTVEYRDAARTVTYGDDHGLEFGFTGQAGLDFNFNLGGLLFRVTPFGEIGAPVVFPTIKDIAGTGATWHDDQGTAVMVPRRLGLMFGVGY